METGGVIPVSQIKQSGLFHVRIDGFRLEFKHELPELVIEFPGLFRIFLDDVFQLKGIFFAVKKAVHFRHLRERSRHAGPLVFLLGLDLVEHGLGVVRPLLKPHPP